MESIKRLERMGGFPPLPGKGKGYPAFWEKEKEFEIQLTLDVRNENAYDLK
jgi:hypothetical protein